jgi:streptogramin lyase
MPAYTGSITGSLPTSIAAGRGSVWVAAEGATPGGSGAVYHFDTNSEEATKIELGGPATGIALIDGAVWVTVDVNQRDARRLVRIDPTTDRVTQTVMLPGAIALQGLAAADGSLWVPTLLEGGRAEIVRIDAPSGRITARIAVRGPVPLIAASSETVWFAVQDERQLVRIDPARNLIDGRLLVGGVPEAFAVDGATVWVTTDPDSGGGPKAPIFVRYDL